MVTGLVRVWLAAMVLGGPVSVAAQDPAAKLPGSPSGGTPQTKSSVTFSHKNDKAKIFDLDLENRQPFIANITDTCPDEFDYSYAGIERGVVSQSDRGATPKAKLTTHPITVVYDDQYGGYVFSIRRKEGVVAGSQCEGSEPLQPASFIVSVREQEWGISFSGGFTFSTLTSPVYGIKTENNVKTIVEENGKQDKIKLGAASFVHVFHDAVKKRGFQPALAFGLGINADNKTEYFAGIGFRLGDKATINVGVAAGSIARLPNGTNHNTPITDDNVLNNLGSRVVGKAFFALSYAFIDTKDKFKKPFATDGTPAAESGKETPKDKAAGTTPTQAIETFLKVPEFAKAFPGVVGAKLCAVEAKAGESAGVWTVTLRYDGLKQPPDAAKVTGYLNEQLKDKAVKATIKPDVTFASCKPDEF
jgi:hypothetical protein